MGDFYRRRWRWLQRQPKSRLELKIDLIEGDSGLAEQSLSTHSSAPEIDSQPHPHRVHVLRVHTWEQETLHVLGARALAHPRLASLFLRWKKHQAHLAAAYTFRVVSSLQHVNLRKNERALTERTIGDCLTEPRKRLAKPLGT